MASSDTSNLLTGAQKIAAARELGLTDDEALQLTARQAQREKAKRRRSGQGASMEEAQAALAEMGSAEPRNVGEIDFSEQDIFGAGRDQSDFQIFQADDRGYTQDAPGATPRKMTMEESRGETRIPKGDAGVAEALARLKSATERFGYSGAREGAAGVEGRLEDSLEYGKAQRGAEQSLAAEMVRRDSSRFNPRQAAYNDVKAQVEAEALLRESMTGRPEMMDQPQMRAAMQDAEFVRHNAVLNAADSSTEVGTYVDPITKAPIAVESPVTTAIAGSNTPNTAQILNAPQQDSAIDFVVRQINPEAGSIYAGRQLGQQNITGVTQDFTDRIRRLGGTKPYRGSGLANVSSNIRSVDELDKTFSAIRSVMGDDASVDQILRKLRMGGEGQQQRLAQALFQLSGAKEGGRNKSYFARQPGPQTGASIFFDSAAALPSAGLSETMVPVEMLREGQKIEGQDIVTALRTLSDPSARTPYIGAVAGEVAPQRFNRTGQTDPNEIAALLTLQAEGRARRDRKPVDKATLERNIKNAQEVTQRAAEDTSKRAAQMSAIIESLPPISRRSFLRGI